MDLFILASSLVINAIQAVFGIPDEDAALPRMNQLQMSDPPAAFRRRTRTSHLMWLLPTPDVCCPSVLLTPIRVGSAFS